MTSRMVGSVLTLVILLFSVAGAVAQTYTQMQWGMNKGVTPYAFGANINGTWRDLGTVSASGAWGIAASSLSAIGNTTTAITALGSTIKAQNSSTTREDIYNGVQPPGSFLFDGVSSTVNIPAGTTAGNVNALGAYVLNNAASPSSPGICGNGLPFACGNGVGVFAIAHCVANDSRCWALNPVVSDTNSNASPPSLTGVQLIGSELDVSVYSPSTIVSGYNATGSSAVQPAGADAFVVGNLRASAPDTVYWTNGFVSNDSAAITGAYIGSAHLTANSPSQPILLSYRDSGNISRAISLQSVLGVLNITGSAVNDGVYIQPATSNPGIYATGSSTDVNLNLGGKGTGRVTINGGSNFTGVATFDVNPQIKGSSTGVTTVGTANASTTSYTATLPANTGTIAETNLAQTFSANQTFGATNLRVQGSSTGVTTLGTANSSATDYTATLPANTGTIAETNLAQTFSATQTFSSGISVANLAVSATAPTISSGFGTSPSVTANNGTAAFRINVGTGGTATDGVVGLPTAANGWNCFASDITTPATGHTIKQSAGTTTSVTLTNYNNAGTATAWAASDIIIVNCMAY